MLAPGIYSESEALSGYLADQLDAIRAAAYGLDDAQARLTPCRSTLSVGGLIKHATYVMRGFLDRDRPESPHDPAAQGAFSSSFSLPGGETLEQALTAFDATRAEYLAAVSALAPDAVYDEPPAPWYGRDAATPATERYALIHHVEELARHAGHADIVREQIDGATAASLMLAVKGLPGNDFVQPWTPA